MKGPESKAKGERFKEEMMDAVCMGFIRHFGYHEVPKLWTLEGAACLPGQAKGVFFSQRSDESFQGKTKRAQGT